MFPFRWKEVMAWGKKFMHLTKSKQAIQCAHNDIVCPRFNAADRSTVSSIFYFVHIMLHYHLYKNTTTFYIIQTAIAYALMHLPPHQSVAWLEWLLSFQCRKTYSMKMLNEKWSVINGSIRCRFVISRRQRNVLVNHFILYHFIVIEGLIREHIRKWVFHLLQSNTLINMFGKCQAIAA